MVVGELNVDIILNGIQGFPELEKEKIAESMTISLGSSSAIMAANSSVLGTATSFCGITGDDSFGKFLIDELRSKGVDTQYISKWKDHKTGATIVMNYGIERANISYCGTMEFLTMEAIPWKELGSFDHLHISSIFLQKGLRKDIGTILKRAKDKGLTTSLDIQWDPEEKWDFNYRECLPLVDVFLPNKKELLALTQSPDIETGLDQLKAHGNWIAIKLGEEGSMGYADGKTIRCPAYKNPEYVDSIGAGDSFNAAFIKKFLSGAEPRECLEYGNLMGALNTSSVGGTGAFESLEGVRQKVKSLFNFKT
ncbi:Sugar or nucleoside kinase, ribokinase family [Pseudozobellia thermophila]|uniref:Sugar or nucleoside kinase, ribokinase family n=1 Tax=Pseudozobellia thermophila TaxID=192903 RepID=A0A1M6NLN8_9FLAO|nr:Sugar or nucleoside kinase, ribokinase family [Pseudozobellia thermophila]